MRPPIKVLAACTCLLGSLALTRAETPPRTASERQALEQEARNRKSQGEKAQQAGQLDTASRLFNQAVRCFEQLYPESTCTGGNAELAQCLTALAFVRLQQGDLDQARTCYERALALYQRLYPPARFPQGQPDLARCLNDLGFLFHERGELTRAQPVLERALAMRLALYPQERFPQGHAEISDSLTTLGYVLQRRGDYARAQRYYERSLAMDEKLYPIDRFPQGHRNLAGSLCNLGFLLYERGELAQAELLLQRSADMNDKLYPEGLYPEGNIDLSGTLSNLGLVLRARGKWAPAQRACERALAINRKLYPPRQYPQGHADLVCNLINLGCLHRDRGDLRQAQNCLESALAMCQQLFPLESYPEGHYLTACSLHSLGHTLLKRGEYAQAQPAYEKALAMRRALAAKLVRTGTEAEALNFVVSLPQARDDYLSLMGHLPGDAQAYAVLWQSKAALTRVLERRQRALRGHDLSPQARELAQRLTQLRRQRGALILARAPKDTNARDARLEQLNGEIDRLDRELLPMLPAAQRSQKLQRQGPEDLQKALPTGTVLVDLLRYLHMEQDPHRLEKAGEKRTPSYVGFIVSRDAIRRVELGPAAPIEDAVTAWRRDLAEGGEGDTHAARLRQLLWDPLAAHLPANTKVIYLSPDGALTRIGWAALPGREADRILLEDYALAVVPHGPFLLDRLTVSKARPESTQRTLLLVGGIDYGPRSSAAIRHGRGCDTLFWPSLPATSRELEQVTRVATSAGWTVRSLTGDRATSAAVLGQLPQARHALLATHGFFADERLRALLQLDEKLFSRRLTPNSENGERIGEGARNPLLLSGLVLTGANQPDTPGRGLLTADDLIGLDLSGLELAVLSACDSGLGEMSEGEAVFGLQRAFHLAGTRDVLASLWHVNDTATQTLVALFFRYLWEQDLPPLEALRQAQLTIYRHPNLMTVSAGDLRGIRLDRTTPPTTADSIDTERAPLAPRRTPARLWAGFLLSGPGR